MRSETRLHIEADDLDRRARIDRGVRLVAGHVDVTDEMLVGFGEEDRCRSVDDVPIECVTREQLLDFSRDRFADAVGGIGVDEDMRGEDAEPQRIGGRRATNVQRMSQPMSQR